MTLSPLELSHLAVAARFGVPTEGVRWAGLGSGGGLSGALVWRGQDPAGNALFALKAWPPDGMTVGRLDQVHTWMARAAHLPFVPAVLSTPSGETVVTTAGRAWDLTRWMPGTADFHARPTAARLANACAALARLHLEWAARPAGFAPCPGVLRRLRVLADWEAFSPRLDGPGPSGHPELDTALRRGAAAVAGRAGAAAAALRPWADRPVAVRPCLCDVRHDHVLFAGDAVTGVVDYGAAKPDHVAVDLARLLGELVADDDAAFSAGLDAYRAAGGPLDRAAEFVRLLDHTGVVCAVAGWVLRLAGGRPCPDPAAVAARVVQLAARLEAGALR